MLLSDHTQKKKVKTHLYINHLFVVGDYIVPCHGEHLCHLRHLLFCNEGPHLLPMSLPFQLGTHTRDFTAFEGKAKVGIILDVLFVNESRVVWERILRREQASAEMLVPQKLLGETMGTKDINFSTGCIHKLVATRTVLG